TVSATVNQQADVIAGLDVTIATSTDARGDATADNLSVGIVFGLGDAEANVDITDTNTASLGFNAFVSAGRNVTLDAHSEHHAGGLAESGGGGIVEIARAFGTLSVMHDTNATVGTSADVVAGNNIHIEAGSDTFALLTLNADGDGLGVGSNTND